MKPKCCFCNRPMVSKGSWRGGNSAWPVSPEGRCCDSCNSLVVIPWRLMTAGFKEEIEKQDEIIVGLKEQRHRKNMLIKDLRRRLEPFLAIEGKI